MKKSKIDTYPVGTKCMFHGHHIRITQRNLFNNCVDCIFNQYLHLRKYCPHRNCMSYYRSDHIGIIFQEIPKSTKKLITDHPINKPFVWHKMTYIPRKYKGDQLFCVNCCFNKTRKGKCDPKQHSCIPSERKDKQNVFYQKKTK